MSLRWSSIDTLPERYQKAAREQMQPRPTPRTIVNRLVLPWPPSVNRYWRMVPGQPHPLISKPGRLYRRAVAEACMEFGAALTGRLDVTIEAHPPDRRKRDLDNLLKAILDALTHAEVWDDDEQIDKLTVIRCGVIAGGRMTVKFSEIE